MIVAPVFNHLFFDQCLFSVKFLYFPQSCGFCYFCILMFLFKLFCYMKAIHLAYAAPLCDMVYNYQILDYDVSFVYY